MYEIGIRQSKRLTSQNKEKNSLILKKIGNMISEYDTKFNKTIKEQIIMYNKIICCIIQNFRIIIIGSNNEASLEIMLCIIKNRLIKTEQELKELMPKYSMLEKLNIKFKNNMKKVIDLCNNYFIYKINILEDKLNPDLLFNLRQYIY